MICCIMICLNRPQFLRDFVSFLCQGTKARLKVADKELKDLKWVHEVLEQRFSKVRERKREPKVI